MGRRRPTGSDCGLQPDAGVTFHVLAKPPGGDDVATELPVSVDFRPVPGLHAPYERVFEDALAGNPAHFARLDNLQQAWRIVGPILDVGTEPLPYVPGTWGPADARS
jgi:glucose-6-phosphate 1-dehydrogenase